MPWKIPGDTGFSYLGIAACGCVRAVTIDASDDPNGKKELAKDLARFVKSGYRLERVAHQEARDRYGFDCDEHKAKQAGLPLTA